MHTECPGMLPTYSIQYGMHACTHKQQFSWSGDQSSTCRYTQCIMQTWHRPRMSIYAILIYRLRYVIGCMLYTNSCQFGILQKVCVQLKISELVKQKCQQSSCPQSVSCPKVKQSPPLQRGHTQVSSPHSLLPW